MYIKLISPTASPGEPLGLKGGACSVKQYVDKMSQWPNIISLSRAIAAVGLFFTAVFSGPFWILYCWGGVSDMIDGPMARKLSAESKRGAIIDSIADFIFIAAAAVKVLPVMTIARWLWAWIALIGLIRIVNIIIGFVRYRRLILLHTAANKITGLLLFILPAATLIANQTICIAVVCIVATFASLQESCTVRE